MECSCLDLSYFIFPFSSSNIMKLLPVSLSFKDYFLALMSRPGLKLGNRINSANTFHILFYFSTRGCREKKKRREVKERFEKKPAKKDLSLFWLVSFSAKMKVKIQFTLQEKKLGKNNHMVNLDHNNMIPPHSVRYTLLSEFSQQSGRQD